MSRQLPDYYYCSRIDLQCSLLIDRHSTRLQLALHYISNSCRHNSIPLYLNLHYSKDSIKDGFFKEGILNRVENCTFAEPWKIIKDTFKDICSAWKVPKQTMRTNENKWEDFLKQSLHLEGVGHCTLVLTHHCPHFPKTWKNFPKTWKNLSLFKLLHIGPKYGKPPRTKTDGGQTHVSCVLYSSGVLLTT